MVMTQTPCINNTVLELAEEAAVGGAFVGSCTDDINVGWCDLPTAP